MRAVLLSLAIGCAGCAGGDDDEPPPPVDSGVPQPRGWDCRVSYDCGDGKGEVDFATGTACAVDLETAQQSYVEELGECENSTTICGFGASFCTIRCDFGVAGC